MILVVGICVAGTGILAILIEIKVIELYKFKFGELRKSELTELFERGILLVLSLIHISPPKESKSKKDCKCSEVTFFSFRSANGLSLIHIYNLTCFEDMVGLSEDLKVLLEDVMERFGRGYSSSRYDLSLIHILSK